MAEDGQRGLHIQIIHIKINKPVKSLNNFIEKTVFIVMNTVFI